MGFSNSSLKSFSELLSNKVFNPFSYPRLVYFVFYLFLIIFAILLIPIFIKVDYESILRIAEFVIIGSGTLAILTFTYAIAKDGTEPKEKETKQKIVYSGELLFKSTIAFIISLGLLPGIGLILKNHTNYSGYWGIVYGYLLFITTIVIWIIGIIGLFSSVLFLIDGLKELMEVFEENYQKDKVDHESKR